MRFPDKTLHDLGWQRLLEHLARRCSSAEAADLCAVLPFLAPKKVLAHLKLVKEFATSIREGDSPPSLPSEPIHEWMALVRGEGAIPGEGLRDIALNLKLYVSLAKFLENRRDVCEDNLALVIPEDSDISPISLARLASEIESSFAPDGTLADNASPELGRLRRRVISLRANLVSSLEHIADRESDILQDRTITLRNDRFVIPVRSDAHRKFPGIVHGASGTGATIFIEPESTVSVGNDLMLAREEVIREEKRILASLCAAVRDQLYEVELACRAMVEAETRIAAARLSVELDCVIPNEKKDGGFELINARHPLLQLDGVKVIPNNITCSYGQSVIISGPNAGGKTVVLKTAGLLSLMLAAGLPIPVDSNSIVSVPSQVLTDIGDDQSLEKNLSTFSAHMTNIASIMNDVKPGALVLLDELAAGTDPTEGAALAEALLEKLNQKGAAILTTTHFDALKARANAADGFVNAAVGFDMDQMRPTFDFRIGTPGSSSALAVAKRFGLEDDIVQRAKNLLPEGMRQLADAVEALEEERRKTFAERKALADMRRHAEDEKNKHARKLSEIQSKQVKFIDREAEALWSSIKSARDKVRQAETTIRRRTDRETVNQARKTVNEIAEKLQPSGELYQTDPSGLPGKPAKAQDLVAGAKVHVITFDKPGTVDDKPRGGRTQVLIGNIKTQVRIEDLRIVQAPSPRQNKTPKSRLVKSKAEIDPSQALRTSENTVDLRGATVDEAINSTEAFLDRGLREDWPAIFILHGHGTGALRSAVRSYLKESSYVSMSRPGEREEGGDGITVAWLR